jgi:oligopeptide/dipeptide ABC transporter ATP-binding protein
MTTATLEAAPLLAVDGLTKTFSGRRGRGGRAAVRAVNDVSFEIRRGETLGLVGESGSGKSTAAACLLRLLPSDGGSVVFDGTDVLALPPARLRELRRRIQVVFQDPYGSLDPRFSVRELVEEPLLVHGERSAERRREQALAMLERVGLSAAQAERNPHAFSGGQRQRIAIARALVLNPDLVVLDEPVTALDVSVQAQILNLLLELQRELGLAYLFIVHDLAVAQYMCHRIAVMYLGQVVETATTAELFARPSHPYTISLLNAAPIPDPEVMVNRGHFVLEPMGNDRVANPGCPLSSRCPVGRDRPVCHDTPPPLLDLTPGHQVACHFPDETAALSTAGAAPTDLQPAPATDA